MSTPPTVGAAKKLMTADEFWEFVHNPENQNGFFELIRGEVIELPRPTRRHGAVACNVARLLSNYSFKVNKGYVVSNDSGVILEEDPDTVVGPDVGYFMDAAAFEEIHPKWGEEVPLLAVEVLSPNDRMTKVLGKVRDYLLNGVKVVWLVDYEDKKVTVFRNAVNHIQFEETADLSGEPELPGFSTPVADLFRIPGQTQPHPPAS
jgi:Uma2 family endonuclease